MHKCLWACNPSSAITERRCPISQAPSLPPLFPARHSAPLGLLSTLGVYIQCCLTKTSSLINLNSNLQSGRTTLSQEADRKEREEGVLPMLRVGPKTSHCHNESAFSLFPCLPTCFFFFFFFKRHRSYFSTQMENYTV